MTVQPESEQHHPPSAVTDETILISTDGMAPQELDAVADAMTAALMPRINAWREKHGLPPLAS